MSRVTENVTIVPTVSEHKIRYLHSNPFAVFDSVSSEQVRIACLKAIEKADDRYGTPGFDEWFEYRVTNLVKGNFADVNVAREMFRVWIFISPHGHPIKACECALFLKDRDEELKLNLRKSLITRARKTSYLYWNVKGMREYVTEVFTFPNRVTQRLDQYPEKVEEQLEQIWSLLYNALRCVLYAKDFHQLDAINQSRSCFSDNLNQLINGLKKTKMIHPRYFLKRAEYLAIMDETAQLLKEMKESDTSTVV